MDDKIKDVPTIPNFGCAIDTRRVESLISLLDSYEEGLLIENELSCTNMYNDKSKYDVVGSMESLNYEYLIQKMREGVCDDVIILISSCGDNDIINLIRYKDREFGEKVRKFHLTLRGFLLEIILLWDED